MRKAALFGAAAVLALGVSTFGASQAKADFDVNADIDKWVSVRIIEVIAKVKLVGLLAIIVNRPDKAAESEALYNQRNERNRACENCAEKVFRLTDSMNRNVGITVLNAADGNMNNQGAAISIAFSGEGTLGFAEASASGTQILRFNTVETVNVPFRNSRIFNSINGNVGVTVLNTAPGNINNQAFALSVAVARPDGDLQEWPAPRVPGVRIGALRHEELHHVAVAAPGCEVQRGQTRAVLDVDVGTVGQQELRELPAAPTCGVAAA